MYGARTKNFPSGYHPKESALNFTNDPDWTVKLKHPRFNFKFWIAIALTWYALIRWQIRRVERFDNAKRKEQRAMQNKEVEELFMKKVHYLLFDSSDKKFEPRRGAY